MRPIKIGVLLLSLLMCAASSHVAFTSQAFAAHSTSVNVAVVPSFSGFAQAGPLDPTKYPGVTFTEVQPATVTSVNNLAAYDTVILFQFCDVATFANFTSALVAWMQTYNGKLIIWDSDSCTTEYGPGPNGWRADYSFLSGLGAYFDVFSAGQTGSVSGSANIVEENKLSSSNSASLYYIDAMTMATTTDAVGDLNVVNENTVAPVWCADMRGTNVLNNTGIAHMYTRIGGLTGAPEGLIIYSGFDWDYAGFPNDPQYNTAGAQVIRKLLGLELAHGWGPPGSPEVADLPCQVPIGNLTLTPPTATNQTGTSHTVTATVTTQNAATGVNTPVPGVVVTFTIISGPNQGLTGTGTSDANGQATFTYSSTATGTDVIQASATVVGSLKTSNQAQKIWIAPPPTGNLTLTPQTATNPTGTSHTVTATVTTHNPVNGVTTPVPDVVVTFTIISGPNQGLTGTGTSDANGQATFTYSSTATGTDVIQASATVVGSLKTDTAQKIWTLGNLTLTPPTATNPIGTSHTVTATVTTQNAATGVNTPVPGVIVTFTIISGFNQGLTGTGTSDANGQATFTYSSTATGTDVIQASATVVGSLKTATAQKIWTQKPMPALGEHAYIAIVGNDVAANAFYFSQKYTQFLHDQDYISVPVCFTKDGVPQECEIFKAQTAVNQPELCDYKGTGRVPPFSYRGLPNAKTPAGNSGWYEWWVRVPAKPDGEINIVIQCGVVKPNAFAAYHFQAVALCAAETGERIGAGTCVRQEVDQGVSPVINVALPKIKAVVYPGPYNNFTPFNLTAFKNPSSYSLTFDAVTAAMSNSAYSQVLDGSSNARILLKACMDKTLITKLPVTGQVNALGQEETDLEAGDMIYVRMDVPRQNTVDIYCHAQSVRIQGIGEAIW